MELRHLRYFTKTADLLNFTRAAQALHVSQPTLSLQIKQLEEEVGALLFDRVGRQVRLTEAGELFRVHAQRALREVELGQKAVSDLQGLERGTLHVGVTYAFSARQIPPILAEYSRLYPQIHVFVREGTTDEVEQGLIHSQLDVGLAYQSTTNEELVAEDLFRADLVLVVHKNHPLANRRSLELQDLEGIRLALPSAGYSTRRLVDESCARKKISLKIVIEMNDIDALLEVVRLGVAATLVSRQTVMGLKDLRTVPLVGARLYRTAALLWRKGSYRSVAARKFAEMAMHALKT